MLRMTRRLNRNITLSSVLRLMTLKNRISISNINITRRIIRITRGFLMNSTRRRA